MHDFDKINPLKLEDRELLSDLKSIFDLGTNYHWTRWRWDSWWPHWFNEWEYGRAINRIKTYNINLLDIATYTFNTIKL